ncbi:MAG: hypothetical protein CL579_05630 [Alteromonadaceae bacterium]|nr:hypothetical protein [Alteromonadaceae bacterium]
MSNVGNVIAPFSSTANPLIVMSEHAKVGVNGCVAVVVQLSVAPTLKYPEGTVISTFKVLDVFTLTIANEDGLVLDIVPMSAVGSVIVPF